MALDLAKKLWQELLSDNAKMDEFKKEPSAFLKAGGYDCTVEELTEASLLCRPVDEEDLQQIAGGFPGFENVPTVPVNPIDAALRDDV